MMNESIAQTRAISPELSRLEIYIEAQTGRVMLCDYQGQSTEQLPQSPDWKPLPGRSSLQLAVAVIDIVAAVAATAWWLITFVMIGVSGGSGAPIAVVGMLLLLPPTIGALPSGLLLLLRRKSLVVTGAIIVAWAFASLCILWLALVCWYLCFHSLPPVPSIMATVMYAGLTSLNIVFLIKFSQGK